MRRMSENRTNLGIEAYDENGQKLRLHVDIVDGKIKVHHISEIHEYES